MEREIYIYSGSTGINLYYEFSLFCYDDLPVVFVATDSERHLFLCNCTEFRFGKQEWIIGKTSVNSLRRVLDGSLTVRDALHAESEEVIRATCDLATGTFTQQQVRFVTLTEWELPAADSFVRFPETDRHHVPIRQIIDREHHIPKRKTNDQFANH